MAKHEQDIRDITALIAKMEDIYRDFDTKHPHNSRYADAREVISLARSRAFCKDPEKLKELDKLEAERELERNPTINLSFNPLEFCKLILGLNLLRQSVEAEQYVKDSIAIGTSSEQRWSKVAEIMLIKNPDEKIRPHGADELVLYAVMIKVGKTPRQASEEVFKKFSFNSQEACDKWLRREIEKYQKNQPSHWFCDLPKPSTAPRVK